MIRFRLAIAVAIGLLFLFCAAPLNAASPELTSLTVHVADPTGAPIAAAHVSIQSPDRSERRDGTTDRDGTATFPGLRAGGYIVDADASGLSTRGASRVTLLSGESREVRLVISAAFETHVVVTGSNAPERREDVAKAVTVVDAPEIEARDVFDIGDAVRAVPGLRVETLGSPGSQTTIRLRGLRPQDTAVLVDGVPFRDLSATQGDASSFISDLLLTGLDRIEVLQGPGSDIYGSNAIGGAVNVISHAGGRPSSRDALVEVGGLGLSRGQGQFGGGAGRLLYRVGASGFNIAHGVDGHDRAWNTSADSRATARLGKDTTVSAFVRGAWAFTALKGGPVSTGDTFISAPDDPDSTRRSTSVVSSIDVQKQMFDRFSFETSYHRVAAARDFSNGPLGTGFQPAGTSQSNFDGSLDTIRARSHVQLSASQTLTATYLAEREHYASTSIPPNLAQTSVVDVAEWNQTVAVQDRTQMLDGSLQVSGGGRAQFFSLRTPEFQPSTSSPYRGVTVQSPPHAYTADVSAAYLITSTHTKLRAHIGTGYREPSLYERFGTSYGSRGYSVYGDPRLASEQSIGMDAGVDLNLFGGRASSSTSVFTTHLEHVIVFDSSGVIARATDPFGRSSGYRTVPGGRASGVEVSMRASLTRLATVTGSYALTANTATNGSRDPSLSYGWPTHQLNIQAIVGVAPRVQLAALMTLASSYLAPLSDAVTFVSRSVRFDGVRRIDVTTSYRHPLSARRGLRIFGRIDNLTDQTYFESGFPTPGRTAAGGVAVEF